MIHKVTVKSILGLYSLLCRTYLQRIHDQRNGVSWWFTGFSWEKKFDGGEFSYELRLEYSTRFPGQEFNNPKATAQDRLEMIRLGLVPNVWPKSDKKR